MIHSDTPASPVPALGFHTLQANGDWTVSWSDLTSYLLAKAESRYGPRDDRWFFSGIEFADVETPMTYYPGNRPFHVAIRLTRSAAANPRQAHFQLAHEIVHLLGPSETRQPANVMEEGMAAAFQLDMSIRSSLGYGLGIQSYVDASQAIAELERIEPGAIAKIRGVHPDLRKLTPAALAAIVPAASNDLVQRLCAPFNRDG